MTELWDDHDRREYESQMKSEARPTDAKTVLEKPSRIKCACGHIAAKHGACCFECPCEASMHEVMKVGYRDALVASEARVEALRAVGLQASYVAGWVRPELVPQHEWDFLMSLVAILRHEDLYATVARTHEEAKAIVARKVALAARKVALAAAGEVKHD